MFTISVIALPTRPQVDTVVAILLLKNFSSEKFYFKENIYYRVITPDESKLNEQVLMAKGILPLDCACSRFDHHSALKKTTASELVAEELQISKNKTVQKLLAFAKRDDFYGKGTLSNDPLDKAFGFSGLMNALNKTYKNDFVSIIEPCLKLLDAHLLQEKNRYEVLPSYKNQLKRDNKFSEYKMFGFRVVVVISDNTELVGYLRAVDGGSFDIVIQCRTTGHINILTKQSKNINLAVVVGLIRKEELVTSGKDTYEKVDLMKVGTEEHTAMWYFDPATKSIFNGGMFPENVVATQISPKRIVSLVEMGLKNI